MDAFYGSPRFPIRTLPGPSVQHPNAAAGKGSILVSPWGAKIPRHVQARSDYFLQLPVIQRIIVDETWLEAERRGCWVPTDDRLVPENVCLVVLRIGQELREASQRALAGAPRMIPGPAELGPA